MTTGKTASQAGHAYVNSILKASKEVQEEYQGIEGIGTKVCLECPNEKKLEEVYYHALQLDLPCSLIVDSGDGSGFNEPTTTAVGIGPITRAQAKFLKKFQLLK